jgi:DNA-binding HxlR family transcriptional regulator
VKGWPWPPVRRRPWGCAAAELNAHGRQRFSDLRDLVDGITAKVLTQRLRQLERDGLVARTMHAEIGAVLPA